MKFDHLIAKSLAMLAFATHILPVCAQNMTPQDFIRESREADRFTKEKRYDVAQRILLRLIATHHGGSHEYASLAFCYTNALPDQQDFHAAEKCATKAVLLNPNSGFAYHALAEARLGLDDFAGTVSAATRCLNCIPPDEGVVYLRARAYAELKKYNEALIDFERYDMIIGKYDKSMNNLEEEGRILLLLGKTEAALKKFKTDKPYRFEQATRNIIVCLQKLKKYPEEISEASELIARNPKDSDSYNLRADLKAEAKDWKGAIADYTSAIELSPTETYYKNRAHAYSASGQESLAKDDLLKADKP